MFVDDLGVKPTGPERRFPSRLWKFTGGAFLVLLIIQGYLNSWSPSPYDLTVLGQTDWRPDGPVGLHVSLRSQPAGSPVAGIPVEVTLSGSGKSLYLSGLTTGPDGSVSPRLPIPDWPEGDYQLVVTARAGRDVETVTRSIKLKRSWDVILTTDRPIYQPGQVIRLRGLALSRPLHRPLGHREMSFSVTDPKGNVVYRGQPLTSPHGIAWADCPLAEELIEGDYQVDCQVGDASTRTSVEVRTYTVPRFKVAVRIDETDARPGQVVRGSASADYVFGKPVAQGSLTINVDASAVGPQPVPPIELTLDRDGKAQFEFRLPRRSTDNPKETLNTQYTVNASVRDATGQTQSRSLSREVGPATQTIRIDVFAESGALVPGRRNALTILTTGSDGRPVSAKVSATGHFPELQTDHFGLAVVDLDQVDDQPVWIFKATTDDRHEETREVTFSIGQLSDFRFQTNKAVYRDDEPILVDALGDGLEPVYLDVIRDGVTATSMTIPITGGRGQAKLDLPADLNGPLLLYGYRYEPDRVTRKSQVIHVVSPRTLKVKATADRPEYRPGEKARIRVAMTDEQGQPAPGAVSLAAVDEAVFGLVDREPVATRDRAGFGLADDLLKPVLAVRAWSPHEFDHLSTANRERVERALFASTSGLAERRIWENKGLDASDYRSALRVLDRPDWEDLARSRGFSSKLIESLRNQSGPHTLVARTYPAKLRVIQTTRESIQPWLAMSFFLVLFMALVMGLAWLGRWSITLTEALVVVSTVVILIALMLPAVQSSRSAARRAAAINDLKLLDMAGADGALSGGSTRVRKSFPETLLWRPELITDDQGQANLEVTLADSITTWRLDAEGVTLDGRLGGSRSAIRVFQPFFIDLAPPVAMIRDDEVAIPVIVSNHLGRPQRVTLRLDQSTGFALQGEPEQALELAAGQVRVAHFRLKGVTIGRHPIQVSAKSEDGADAVTRPMDVVADGQLVERISGGQLDQPAEVDWTIPDQAIEGSVAAFAKIYPTRFSQLVEGLDAIFRMPHGCFEQTSSTTYPNVLAFDYLRKTGQSLPAVEARARDYIHLGYQRLLSFEVPGGGFDWFGQAPANRTLTAYGLMEFQDMARVYQVDPALIARTRKWLLDQQQTDGTWEPDGHGLESGSIGYGPEARLAMTAYVAQAVFEGQPSDSHSRNALGYLKARSPQAVDNPYPLALVANALMAIEPGGAAARPWVDRLAAIRKTSADGKQSWWEPKPGQQTLFYGQGQAQAIESTSLATLAMLGSGQSPSSVRGTLSWLIGSKDGQGTWHSTQATVQALRALLAATGRPIGGDQTRRIGLVLDGNSLEDLTIPGDQNDVVRQVDLSRQLARGPHNVRLQDRGQAGSGYQTVLRYHIPEAGEPPPQPTGSLTIKLDYDRSKVAVGEPVQASATVTNLGPEPAAMVVLELPIPAGFEVVGQDLELLVTNGTIAKSQRNPRRIVIYLRALEATRSLTLSYKLAASMAVDVASSPAAAYEYYAPDRRATSRGSRLVVEPR